MGELIRATDWTRTPLGAQREWAENLRSTLGLCLDSAFPIAIYWGPRLALLYNDAWRPILGDKHPWALGRPADEVWPEIWDAIEPVFHRVIDTRVGVFNGDSLLAMHRHGYVEECYFDYTFNPIRQGERVAGIFNVVIETTYRVIAERRGRIQRDFAARLAGARGLEELIDTAARALEEASLDVPFALIYRLSADGREARLARAVRVEDPRALKPESWPVAQAAAKLEAQRIDDVSTRVGRLPGGAWPEAPREALVLPVAVPGEAVPHLVIVLGASPRRALDTEYAAFFESLASHVSSAIAAAQAFEAERKRAESLAALDRAKTTFFSNISHELRTPLTLMLGPLQDLLSDRDDPLVAAKRDLLALANRNGERLLKLVNTLLEFSRIEAGRVQARYEPTDLVQVTADLVSNFRSACERAGLRLTVDCGRLSVPVYVDRDMWERIVLNLVSNAFKFTLQGEIAVTLTEAEGCAVLSVKDTGAGIPAEALPRLFERFHRVEGTQGRSHEGTGIGLALSQELARLHGGEIRVASTPGQGSTFTVALPLGTRHLPAERIAGSASAAASSRAGAFVEEALSWLGEPSAEGAALVEVDAAREARRRVLVADDNADMRDYVCRLLRPAYDVTAVADGEQALAAARAVQPDLVVSDVMMPRLDGFGLLRALRGDERTRAIPVIMLSARAGEEARMEGLQAGADDYLVKPFSARELLVRAGATIALSRLRRESERILAGISDGFVSFDRDWRYTYVNDAAAAMMGKSRGELLGRNVWELFPDMRGTPLYEEFQRAMRDRAPIELQFFEPKSRRWFDNRLYPTESGMSVYFLDVTEHKKAQQALQEADRRKDEFLATLAHELRNPLAPVRMAVEVLKRAPSEANRDAARDVIERQVGAMTRLIDDLMDVSRISRGKVELRREHTDLKGALNDAIDATRALIDAAQQSLSVTLPSRPLPVFADRLRLTQVFTNLLNNASKYSDPGARILLEARLEAGLAVVSVKDEGIGIELEMLDKIWDMFVQADRSLERSHGGLGIGLTLVRSLVAMHGGSVAAESAGPGRGATFHVRIPLEASRLLAASDARGASALPSALGARVLVADDNRDAAQTLGMVLQLAGCEVEIAHDGQSAFHLAARFKPDVAVLDLGMPRLNGLDLARRIREQPWGRTLTLVAITGWGQDQDRTRSRAAGFDHHLVKPVAPETLTTLLARLGSNKRVAAGPET